MIYRTLFYLLACTTGTLFCADPYEEARRELSESFSSQSIDKWIQEDEQARNKQVITVESSHKPFVPSFIPTKKIMTAKEEEDFRKKMVERVRAKQFGNVGGR